MAEGELQFEEKNFGGDFSVVAWGPAACVDVRNRDSYRRRAGALRVDCRYHHGRDRRPGPERYSNHNE